MTGSSFTEHIVVPVADEGDARTTGEVLSSYRSDGVTILHVVEKGDEVPDETPIDQSEQVAEAAFRAFRSFFPEADTEIAYRRDVVGAVIDVDATAIAVRPRGGSRILRVLADDLARKPITRADRAVIATSEQNND